MSYRLGQLLTHPLRHRLLFEYQGTPACPSDVARRIARPLNLVSYHTNVLAEHGVLELVRTQRRRGGTAHYYRSTVPEIIEEEGWAALPSPVRRALVRGSLATIAEETHVAALSGGFDGASAHVSRWPVTLDDQAVGEVTRLLRTLLDDLARIQVESDRRAGDPLGHYEVVLMAFAAGPEAVD